MTGPHRCMDGGAARDRGCRQRHGGDLRGRQWRGLAWPRGARTRRRDVLTGASDGVDGTRGEAVDDGAVGARDVRLWSVGGCRDTDSAFKARVWHGVGA
jgi:hypothetical protein